MSSAEMLGEDGPNGTQEFHPNMDTVTGPDGGPVIWDPISKSYVPASQERKPDMHQVPGTPPAGVDFQERAKNPQFEGVFAKTAATRMVQFSKDDDWGVYSDTVRGPYNTPLVYRGTFDECRAWIKSEGRYASHIASWSPEPANEVERFTNASQEFWDMAEATTNKVQKRQYYQKADYYKRMAEMYRRDPAAEQADHAGPAATSESDVYNDAVPKRNPGMTDDSFPANISHHIPEVTSMLNTGRNSYTDPETPNLRDCPEQHCGGKMMDQDDESACHDCGHREKVHYAAEKDAGFLAPLALGAGELAGGAIEGMGVTNALRAGNLMTRVMGGGGDGGSTAQAETPGAGDGSSVANDSMQSMGKTADYGGDNYRAYPVDQYGGWDGVPSWERSGDPYTDLGVAEEKLAMGECTQAEYDALLQAAIRYVEDPNSDFDHNFEEANGYHGAGVRIASSVTEESDGFGSENSGYDSEPHAGNKGSELQDQAADELESDNDGDAGGSKSMRGEELFLAFEPYLESIADNHDSHNDPIAKAVHEALLADDAEYLNKAARYEISKTSSGQCPTCHIDLTNGATACGGPPNIACPLGFVQGGQSVPPAGQNPAAMGQPMASKTADHFNDIERQWEMTARSVDPDVLDAMRDWLIDYEGSNPNNKWAGTRWNTASMSPDGRVLMAMDDFFPGGYEDFAAQQREIQQEQEPYSQNEQDRGVDEWYSKTAARPKMCPAHEHLVNYALTLQDPAAALGAFAGQLFGEHSCQGGWAAENANGNPIKCKYKPEMIKQEYWDEKEAQREQRKLEREQLAEQQQALMAEQVQQPVVEAESEGQLVGGPALDEQLEQVQQKQPVTQDIPSFDGFQTAEDYIPAEQGAEVVQFPTRAELDPNFRSESMPVAAAFKWSGPGMLTPELAPDESPEAMFADSPPEELPEESAVSTDAPLDSEGQPIEVGMSYEVQSPMSDDVVPDTYKITAVDPNFIQFEVGNDSSPLKFTDTLSTAQITSDGLRFTPMSGEPNAMGEVEPSGNSDASGEGDQPGSITDLDTGGNSHASAFVDRLEKMAWEAPPQGDEINALYEQIAALRAQVNELESAALEHQMGQREQAQVTPYSDSDYDDGGEGDSDYDQHDAAEEGFRQGSTMEGNPDLDWLNDGSFDKTAGRDYSLGEQRGFVNESGEARNLDKLDLSGTHYPVAGSDDPYDNFLW